MRGRALEVSDVMRPMVSAAGEPLSGVGFRPADDIGGAHRAGLSRGFASTLAERKPRNAADARTGPPRPHPPGVDLDEPHVRLQARGRLLEAGGHLAAGSAPRRPEIHQHRDLVARDVAIEGSLVERRRVAGEQGLVALAAVRRTAELVTLHAVR